MSLRSRIERLEAAARRRRWRGHPVQLVRPRMEFDLTNSATRDFLAEVAELRGGPPVRDLTRAGGRPIHRMQNRLDVARFILADFGRGQRWISAIDRALAVSPVSQTGTSGYE